MTLYFWDAFSGVCEWPEKWIDKAEEIRRGEVAEELYRHDFDEAAREKMARVLAIEARRKVRT